MPMFTVLNPNKEVVVAIPQEIRIENAIGRYTEAMNLVSKARYVEASQIFEELLEVLDGQFESNSEKTDNISRTLYLRYLIHKNYSSLLNRCEEPILAIEQAELALKVNSDNAYLWCELGVMLLNMNMFDKSVGAFKTGLNFSPPQLVSIRCYKGICEGLYNMGDFETCLVYIDKVIKVDPSYYRGTWIKNKIIDEYMKCVQFSLENNVVVNDLLALHGVANVLFEKKISIDNELAEIEQNNSAYFNALVRNRIVPWKFKEEVKDNHKVIECPRNSFYHLGLLLIEEFDQTLRAIDDNTLYSPPPLVIRSQKSTSDNNVDSEKCNLNGPLEQQTPPSSIQTFGLICSNSSQTKSLPSSFGIEITKVTKTDNAYQRSRRVSKRLEDKASSKPALLMEYDNYEKLETVFKGLDNIKQNFNICHIKFDPDADSMDTIIYNVYTNLLNPLFQNTSHQKQSDKKDKDEFDLKCDSKKYNDEDMFHNFVDCISQLECDIFGVIRAYCCFSITESTDLSGYTTYNKVLEHKWVQGTKKSIIDIVYRLEELHLGLDFWKENLPLINENGFFAFLISLVEIMSDDLIVRNPNSCVSVLAKEKSRSDVALENFINACSCYECLLERYLLVLRLFVSHFNISPQLLVRFYWVFADVLLQKKRDGYTINEEESTLLKFLFSECACLLEDDETILTYNSSHRLINEELLYEKFASIEIGEFISRLTHPLYPPPILHVEKIYSLYLAEDSDEQSETRHLQKIRTIIAKETDEGVKFKILDVLKNNYCNSPDAFQKLPVLARIFCELIIVLCYSKDVASSIEKCIQAANDLLKNLDVTRDDWIFTLKAKNAILSNGKRISLFNFLLDCCYLVGSLSCLLLKNRDTWMHSKKLQSLNCVNLIESFCITSWRMVSILVAANFSNKGSSDLMKSLFDYMSTAHSHLAKYSMCASSQSDFLLMEVSFLKSFNQYGDEICDEKTELNQCYRCLYGTHFKAIPTVDHQTPRQQLSENAALNLFIEMSAIIEDDSLYISKSTFQEYTDLLLRIGDVLEGKICCKASLLSYNRSTINNLLNRHQSYCYPFDPINVKLASYPFDNIESDQMKFFCKKFYYIYGLAAIGQFVCRRGAVQLVNPEKMVSVLELSIDKFTKYLCVVPSDYKVWTYLGDCYSNLENEYFGRSANFVIKNSENIYMFRRRALNAYIISLLLCEELAKNSITTDPNLSAVAYSNEIGNIWGCIGELCYNIYDLPIIYHQEPDKQKNVDRNRYLSKKIIELRMKTFDTDDAQLQGKKRGLFGLGSGQIDRLENIEPISLLYEITNSSLRRQEQCYHEYMRLLMEESFSKNDVIEQADENGYLEEYEGNYQHKMVLNALLNSYYPFARPKNAIELSALALKKAISHPGSSKKNWVYHMLLGNASWVLKSSNEVIIDYYIKSIYLTSKDTTAKDQEIILEPYIELMKFTCISCITNKMSLDELERLKETLSETEDRVFQTNKQPSKQINDGKVALYREPNINNTTITKDTQIKNTVFEHLSEMVSKIHAMDKNGCHHEHTCLASMLYYFFKNDIEAAKEELMALLKLRGWKFKGFMNIWRTDYERPGNIFLCTHKYIIFALLLLEFTNDLESLRMFIKKLHKSEDRILWPEIINKKTLEMCLDCVTSTIKKLSLTYPQTNLLTYNHFTTDPQLIESLASAIVEIITPDLAHIIEILNLTLEIGDYLPVGPEIDLNSYLLHIYRYFINDVISELENKLNLHSIEHLRNPEAKGAALVLREFFTDKSKSAQNSDYNNDHNLLQFVKTLLKHISLPATKPS